MVSSMAQESQRKKSGQVAAADTQKEADGSQDDQLLAKHVDNNPMPRKLMKLAGLKCLKSNGQTARVLQEAEDWDDSQTDQQSYSGDWESSSQSVRKSSEQESGAG